MNEDLKKGIIEEIRYQTIGFGSIPDVDLTEEEIEGIATVIMFDDKFNAELMNVIRERIRILKKAKGV